MKHLSRVAAVAALLVALAPGSAAQEPPEGAGRTVSGVVRSGDDGSPLRDVVVRVDSTQVAAVTSADGGFVLREVPPGVQTFRFDAFGYGPVTLWLDPAPGEPLLVTMVQAAIPIEGFEVRVRSLEERLDSVQERLQWRSILARAGDVPRVATAQQLRQSEAPDAMFFLPRMNIGLGGCFGCVRVFGVAVAPVVYLDEEPLPEGLLDLSLTPLEDICRIEALDRGASLWVYTCQFMLDAAQGRRTISVLTQVLPPPPPPRPPRRGGGPPP